MRDRTTGNGWELLQASLVVIAALVAFVAACACTPDQLSGEADWQTQAEGGENERP